MEKRLDKKGSEVYGEKTKCTTNGSALATALLCLNSHTMKKCFFFRCPTWILITQMEWAEARQMVRVKTGTWEVISSVAYK